MDTNDIKMAINRLECGNTAHSKNADYIRLAINSLKAWEEVINELENISFFDLNMGSLQAQYFIEGKNKALDIIKQKLEK